MVTSKREPPELTRRERDVLIALCRPLLDGDVFTEPAPVREIAAALVVTEAAVKQHLGHLYDKFGIAQSGERRRIRLANEAIRRGAVPLMDLEAPDEPVLAGRVACLRQDWELAFQLLSTAGAAQSLDPDDLNLLAEAALWSGRSPEALDARQQAYQAYQRAGNVRRAALAAVVLAIHHASRLDLVVAQAWFGKAQRLLGQVPEAPEHGHLALVTTLVHEAAGRWDAVLETAREMFEIGRRDGDADLGALGLTFQGLVLVQRGEIEEGTRLLDEAMAGALGGELSLLVTGIIYCRMISVCLDLHDYRRAGEWIDAVERCRLTTGMDGLPGDCRTHRVAILFMRGDWTRGAREAVRAFEETQAFHLPHSGAASYELGEIRLRQGDLEGAEEAFLRAREFGYIPQPGMALLRLAQADVAAALSSIDATLAEPSLDRLARLRLLPAKVEIALAAGDVQSARASAVELEETAGTYGTTALCAAAECAWGAVELAEGNAVEAVSRLSSGERLWRETGAPYEAGRARALLAEAHLARGDRESCLLELRAATSAFERLGARLDAERGARLAAEMAVAFDHQP